MASRSAQITTKSAIDLIPGDVLIGIRGGRSMVEDSSDHSGYLGFIRIITEHGQLYVELDTEVKVLENSAAEDDKENSADDKENSADDKEG